MRKQNGFEVRTFDLDCGQKYFGGSDPVQTWATVQSI